VGLQAGRQLRLGVPDPGRRDLHEPEWRRLGARCPFHDGPGSKHGAGAAHGGPGCESSPDAESAQSQGRETPEDRSGTASFQFDLFNVTTPTRNWESPRDQEPASPDHQHHPPRVVRLGSATPSSVLHAAAHAGRPRHSNLRARPAPVGPAAEEFHEAVAASCGGAHAHRVRVTGLALHAARVRTGF